MRRLVAAFGVILGLALALGLVLKGGLSAIGGAIVAIGWPGLAAVSSLQLLSLFLCAAAWWIIGADGRLRAYVNARWMRDGFSNLLGFLPAIGVTLGARALTESAGATAAAAAASTIVDVVVEGLSQAVYTAIGLVALAYILTPAIALPWLAPAIVAAAPIIALFIVTRHARTLRLGEQLAAKVTRLAGSRNEREPVIAAAIDRLYARRGRLVAGAIVHLLGWAAGAVQIWAASRPLPHPLGFAGCLSLEALVYAGRSAFFWLPWGLGVQEGGFVLIGATLGLPVAQAIALSAVLRARDLVVGAPAVFTWLWRETRHLSARRLPLRPHQSPAFGHRARRHYPNNP